MVDQKQKLLIAFFLLLYLVILLRNAWICDDAYISLRVVDNFVNGFGLRWNIADRVQAYTHPLWLLLISIVYFFTNEALYTVLFLSTIISVTAAAILAFVAIPDKKMAILALMTLCLSQFFVEYSTSGLENPLSHLLLVSFLAVLFRPHKSHRTLFWLSLLASLAMVNRIDTILFTAPVLVYLLWQQRSSKAVTALVAGAAPLILWELFSFFYYGSFVPNTAYAKISTGIDRWDMIIQGLHYLESLLFNDRLMAIVILIFLGAGFLRKVKYGLPLAIGVLLYLLYVVSIGGCFMIGRYFSVAFVVSVISLCHWKNGQTINKFLPVTYGIILFGLILPSSTLYNGTNFGLGENHNFGYGIANERFYYFQATNPIVNLLAEHKTSHRWAREGKVLRAAGPAVVGRYNIGFMGYYAGPQVHIIDRMALADPLLSRLPSILDINWRIGHFTRQFPEGYLESLRSGSNQLADPSLKIFYDKLSYIITAPLFDWNRITTAFKMNIGSFDSLLRAVEPIWYTKSLSEVNQPKTPGTPWWGATIFVLPTRGIKINMEKPTYGTVIELSVDGNDFYDIIFLKDKTTVYKTDISPNDNPPSGLAICLIMIPDSVASSGFDAITISPTDGDGKYSFGHLRIVDELKFDSENNRL